jgi:hypothetical protein
MWLEAEILLNAAEKLHKTRVFEFEKNFLTWSQPSGSGDGHERLERQGVDIMILAEKRRAKFGSGRVARRAAADDR